MSVSTQTSLSFSCVDEGDFPALVGSTNVGTIILPPREFRDVFPKPSPQHRASVPLHRWFRVGRKTLFLGGSIPPKERFDQKERQRHSLLKAYDGRPFEFAAKFSRVLYSTSKSGPSLKGFYEEICSELFARYRNSAHVKAQLRREQRALRREEKRQIIKMHRFDYTMLEVEPLPEIEEVPETKSVSFTLPQRERDLEAEDNLTFLEFGFLAFKDRLAGVVPPVESIRVRSPELLIKLRERIRAARNSEVAKTSKFSVPKGKKFFKQYIITKNGDYYSKLRAKARCKLQDLTPSLIHHQMDGAHGSASSKISCSQNSNVILTSQRLESKAKTKLKQSIDLFRASLGAKIQEYRDISDRWMALDTFIWKGTHNRNTIIKEYVLPAALKKLCNSSVNAMPFSISTYWQGDIEIKITINSNKFQIGQLQCAWLYEPEADKNIAQRKNIYSLSQTNHCLINAGSSNDGYLYIQYIHPKSALPTISSSNNSRCLELGNLYISVLNPLTCPDGTAKECSVTIWVAFKNAMYGGMKDANTGEFIYPEMETIGTVAAVQVAEKVLANVMSDRDNPPYQQARMAMVPQSNQSLCVGNNIVEPINCLRLDATGQAPVNISGPDEMSVQHVAGTYGLTSHIDWKKDHATGSLLATLDASPMWSVGSYHTYTLQSDNMYYMPPVAVLSSLFAYWSGELKLRLDVVASQYHTGRLLVAYVPLFEGEIKLEQAKSYPCEIFDLQERQQFVFTVPYIADVPLWPRRLGYTRAGDSYTPPGRVFIFVLNPLIPMDNVSPTVEMNLYWAGGDTFQVSVPATPSLGTCFFPANDKPSTVVKAKEGYFPWYLGFNGTHNLDVPMIRYGALYDHIAQFVNTKRGKYYKITNKMRTGLKIQCKTSPDEGEQEVTYAYDDLIYYPLDLDDGYGAVYLAFCTATQFEKFKHDITIENAVTYGPLIRDDSAPYTTKNIEFDEFDIEVTEDVGFERIDHEMDERSVITTDQEQDGNCKVEPGPSMISGNMFGEKFNDLKSLCRRYQPYGMASLNPTTTAGDVAFTLPVYPQGLDVPIESKKTLYGKLCRDGTIPLILSGYRYFSGGVRFQLVNFDSGIVVWVQHRPDYEAAPQIKVIGGSVFTAEQLINPGYAMYLQSTRVNNIISFEVPFYKPRSCIYLQRPDVRHPNIQGAMNLGQVYVGYEGYYSGKANVSIFYSLADDARAYVFQGFPPVLTLDELPKASQSTRRHVTGHRIHHQIEVNLGISPDVKDCLKNISTALSSVPHLADVATTAMEDYKVKANAVIMDLLGHLGHVFINPTKIQISWALFHLLAKLGVVGFESINGLTSRILPAIGAIFKDLPADGGSTEPFTPEPPPEDRSADDVAQEWSGVHWNAGMSFKDAILSICTVLFSLTAGACKLTAKPPRNMGSFVSSMVSGLTSLAKDHNNLLKFFCNIMETFKKILEYLTLWSNKSIIFEKMASEELPMIADWFDEVTYLTDVTKEEHVFARDSKLAPRIEEAFVIGGHFGKYLVDYYTNGDEECKKNFGPIYTMFNNQFKLLTECRNNMHRRGYSAASRREPFTIWFEGQPGIGKSVVAQRIIPRILRSMDIKYQGEAVFTLPCGANYWNGCRYQPCILIDDYLCVNAGEMRDQAVRDLFAIKAPAVLNPPLAAIPDKELRYTPEIAVICSNHSFPRTTIADDTAVWRRREVLCKVQVKKELLNCGVIATNREAFKQRCDQLNIDYTKNEHLEFHVAKHPAAENTGYLEPMNYEEFVAYLGEKGKLYREDQMVLYNERLVELENNYLDEDDDIQPSIKEKLDEYKRACKFMLNNRIRADKITYKEFMQLAFEMGKTGFISQEKMDCVVAIKTRINAECLLPSCRYKCRSKFLSKPPNFRFGLTKIAAKPILNNFFNTTLNDVFTNDEIPYLQNLSDDLPEETARVVSLISALRGYNFEVKMRTREKMIVEFAVPLMNHLNQHYTVVIFGPLDECLLTSFSKIAIIMPCTRYAENCDCLDCYSNLINSDSIQGSVKNYLKALSCKCILLTKDYTYDPVSKCFKSPDENVLPSMISADGCGAQCVFKLDTALHDKILYQWGKKNPTSVRLGACPEQCTPKTKIQSIRILLSSWVQKTVGSLELFWKKYCSTFVYNIWSVLCKLLPWLLVGGFLTYFFLPTVNPGEMAMRCAGVTFGSMAATYPIAPPPDEVTPVNLDNVLHTDLEPESKHYTANARPARPRKLPIPSLRQVARLESSTINQQIQVCLRRLHENSYILSDGDLSMRVLFLYENVLLYLKHYHECALPRILSRTADWHLTSCRDPRVRILVDPNTWLPRFEEDSAIGYVRVSNAPMHKSLLQFIAPVEAHRLVLNTGLLFTPDTDTYSSSSVPLSRDYNIEVSERENMTAQRLTSTYKYPWHGAGRCGTILLSPNLNKPIIGIHVAGGGRYGYAEPVYSESYSQWQQPMDVTVSPSLVEEESVVSSKLVGNFIPIGKIHDRLRHHESGKTSIIPSLAHDIFPVVSAPGVLKLGDPRMPEGYSPLFAGVNNMFKPPKMFPQHTLRVLNKVFKERLVATCKPVKEISVYEMDEVICGIPGLKYYDGIEMNTSEGFPFSRYRPAGASDKRWLFNLEGNPQICTGINPDLSDLVQKEIDMRAKGIVVPTIFDDCLKDARLPLESVTKPGKTRIFSISPVQYTIAFKMYFFDFLASFRHSRLEMCHAVGIAPDGPEWGDLVSKLITSKTDPFSKLLVKNKYLCGDYKNFGPTLASDIVSVASKAILYWYDSNYSETIPLEMFKEHQRIRACLLQELRNAYHLCGDNVYQVLCGCPSGSPITTELNSMVNELYLLSAWLNIMKADEYYRSSHAFYDCVTTITYGDDVIMSVSERVIDQFNNVTLAEYFRRQNIGYTDISKGVMITPYYDDIYACSFLKRGFAPHPKFPRQWLAPLNLAFSVKDVANWCHAGMAEIDATELSLEACSSNAYGHGPSVHDEIRQRCQRWLSKAGRTKILRLWDELDQIHFKQFYRELKIQNY